ncbi:MAG TPA: hypothetical protein VK646_05065 [Actinomycetota bacterium]|nr:hypothetical protein [Actinomycetota bacterium]
MKGTGALGRMLALTFFLAACTGGSGRVDGTHHTPAVSGPARLDAYAALISHLAGHRSHLYVNTRLCYELLETTYSCPDRLDHADQRQLSARLPGRKIDFVAKASSMPFEPYLEIVMSPIVLEAAGLRVEGGVVCGALCGEGSVYVLVHTRNGFQVRGEDGSYGHWRA